MSARQDLGKVAIVPKGDWNGASVYEKLDVVKYGGGSYIAKQNVPAGESITNETYWKKLVDKGDDGHTPDVDLAFNSSSVNPIANKPVTEAFSSVFGTWDVVSASETSGSVSIEGSSKGVPLKSAKFSLGTALRTGTGTPSDSNPREIVPASLVVSVGTQTVEEIPLGGFYTGKVNITTGTVTKDAWTVLTINGDEENISFEDYYDSRGRLNKHVCVVHVDDTPLLAYANHSLSPIVDGAIHLRYAINGTFTTEEEMRAYLAEHPATVVYKTDGTETVTIAPINITAPSNNFTLGGLFQNTETALTASANPIEVEYYSAPKKQIVVATSFNELNTKYPASAELEGCLAVIAHGFIDTDGPGGKERIRDQFFGAIYSCVKNEDRVESIVTYTWQKFAPDVEGNPSFALPAFENLQHYGTDPEEEPYDPLYEILNGRYSRADFYVAPFFDEESGYTKPASLFFSLPIAEYSGYSYNDIVPYEINTDVGTIKIRCGYGFDFYESPYGTGTELDVQNKSIFEVLPESTINAGCEYANLIVVFVR